MKLFEITYDGLWLGGKAIVLAGSEKTALKKVREEVPESLLANLKVFDVHEITNRPKIIYNDTGDY